MSTEFTSPSGALEANNTDASVSLIDWLNQFFKGVGQAWNKITWPTVQKLIVQVLITIGVTALVTLVVWGLDNLYRFLIQTFVL